MPDTGYRIKVDGSRSLKVFYETYDVGGGLAVILMAGSEPWDDVTVNLPYNPVMPGFAWVPQDAIRYARAMEEIGICRPTGARTTYGNFGQVAYLYEFDQPEKRSRRKPAKPKASESLRWRR